MLIVNRKFRVANDVDEENMRDLELDLFLDLNGHLVGRLFLSNFARLDSAPFALRAGQ